MNSDTPSPNPCRSSSPLRDRLDRLCCALYVVLHGDRTWLQEIASEMARMGYGNKLDNLAQLTAIFTPPTG